MEVMDHRCWETTLSDIVKVLFESGEDGMTGFSNIVFVAGGAGDNVDNVGTLQGKGAECGEASVTVLIVYELSRGVMLAVRCVWNILMRCSGIKLFVI